MKSKEDISSLLCIVCGKEVVTFSLACPICGFEQRIYLSGIPDEEIQRIEAAQEKWKLVKKQRTWLYEYLTKLVVDFRGEKYNSLRELYNLPDVKYEEILATMIKDNQNNHLSKENIQKQLEAVLLEMKAEIHDISLGEIRNIEKYKNKQIVEFKSRIKVRAWRELVTRLEERKSGLEESFEKLEYLFMRLTSMFE